MSDDHKTAEDRQSLDTVYMCSSQTLHKCWKIRIFGIEPVRRYLFKSTILERIDSIKTNKNNAHPMNPSNAITVGEVILFSPFIAIYKVVSKQWISTHFWTTPTTNDDHRFLQSLQLSENIPPSLASLSGNFLNSFSVNENEIIAFSISSIAVYQLN